MRRRAGSERGPGRAGRAARVGRAGGRECSRFEGFGAFSSVFPVSSASVFQRSRERVGVWNVAFLTGGWR